MKSKCTFAAVFRPEEVGGYSVYFPQIDGCFTEGDTFEEAEKNAREALSLHLYGMEEDGIAIPKPDLHIEVSDGIVVAITAWTDMIREEMKNRSVKKTVTLPAWMNEAGEAAGVNFSQILQNAIRDYLRIQ
jgi:predicted RNase H-like HicB family nuclease